ncbi:uncharacterized protein [Temnothorax longispinosus]|uniref:uncharacterized protein n=1 Tax=Temnothorax longispinosus TaxID=300112 RepID=UPI003A998991
MLCSLIFREIRGILRKTRTVVRAAFTRAHTTLRHEISKEDPEVEEIIASFALFKEKASVLEDLNEKIFQWMQDTEEIQEEEMIKEIENADEYRIRISTEMNPLPRKTSFNTLFKPLVKDSRAYELVNNSFPPTADNYDKVIDSLKSRFGRDELLIELYIRELLKLVLNNTAKKEFKMSVVSLYDKLETHLRALESLNVTTEMCAAMLYPLVESSLPEELLRVWQKHPSASGITVAKDRLTRLMSFLQTEVEAEERIAMAVSSFGLNTKEKKGKNAKLEPNETPTAASLYNAKETRVIRCIFCNENHESSLCDKARKMPMEERISIVKDRNACFNCLKIEHSYPTKTVDNINKTEEQSLTNLSLNPRVFLQTLRVKLINGSREQTVRAVLDTGSHRSYILGHVAEQLGFEQLGKQTMTHLLFGGTKTQPQEHNCYRIHLRCLDNSYACNFVAFHQDIICQNIQQAVEGSWLEELRQKSIKLSDVKSDNQPISLLIGADILGKLYTGKIYNLKNGLTAMETRLGWVLIGKTPEEHRQDTALMVSSMFSLDASLADMWNLDVLGIEDPIQKSSKEEHQREVLKKFQETTKINSTGRYEVILPWKENHPPLCENRDVAERRLENTLRKLRTDKLLREYEEIFDEWLAEGIIEEVSEEEIINPGFYLPHRPVIKENSTTRIRPVFDASVKATDRPSLNQCLETGPNFIELIPSLLLRFRENKVGVIADIRKAFLQISVAAKERDVMRFL